MIFQNRWTAKILVFALLAVFVFGLLRISGVQAQVSEEEYYFIDNDVTWGPGDYIVEKGIFIDSGATLTIEKGARIIFKKKFYFDPFIQIEDGNVIAIGTPDEKISFEAADEISKNYTINFSGKSFGETSEFNNVDFRGGGIDFGGGWVVANLLPRFINTAKAAQVNGFGVLNYASGNVSVKNTNFREGNYFSVTINSYISDNYNKSGFFEVIDSNFENSNKSALISSLSCGSGIMDCADRILLKNNWYGSSDGPRTEAFKDRSGAFVSGLAKVEGWSQFRFESVPAGPSNVIFLPGIKASRLYKDGALGSEDKLWPPNYFGNDLEDLALDEDGKSISNVYTRDALDEVAIPLVGGNIYKTFLQKLADLKESGTINDYESFAYDWRQNVEDVAKNGTAYEDQIKSVISSVETLAESSKSKKVTIIAHSNGGLLAKAIMIELESRGLADRVDKIVMVGTPQMGTPLAMLSLLYGYDESTLFGTLISMEESRNLAENMPGAYGLLPSAEYFNRMENPFTTFNSQNTEYKKYSNAYGEHISNPEEFFDFLSGKEGRAKPDSDELEKENILNEKLLTQAQQLHSHLDNWKAPEGIEVIQIAGWGLDTVSGVKYSEKEKMDCYAFDNKIPSCFGIGEYEPIYEPVFTVDGDGVVVTPSALMMSEDDNIKRYWVDLRSNNKYININRKHKDLTEVDPVLLLLDKIIRNKVGLSELPDFIKTLRPSDYDNAKPQLRMSLYSPLDIHLYDEKGNHTGPKKITLDGHEKVVLEEGISNSYYYKMGDRKFVGFDENQKIRVEMDGYAMGTYSLKLEEIKINGSGEQVLSKIEFSNLPTTNGTKVSFEIPVEGLSQMTTLNADLDGDGKDEYELRASGNGKVVLPVTLEMISANVEHLRKLGFIKDDETQRFLQVKIKELLHARKMVEKMSQKDKNNPLENKIKLFDKKIDDLIVLISGKLVGKMNQIAQDTLIKDLESVKIK